jgi:hypothetical protein
MLKLWLDQIYGLDRLLRGKLMLKDAVVTPEQVSESDMIQAVGL